MIEVEKISHLGKEFLKITFKSFDKDLWASIMSIDGWFKGKSPKTLGVPFEKLHEFNAKTKDALVVWKRDGDSMGALTKGIETNDIPKGYMVDYQPKIPLREHQIIGFNLMMMRERLLISDQEGVGKTPTVLCAIEAKIKMGQIKWGLYITKASLIYDVINQAKRFTNLRCLVITGNKEQRMELYASINSSKYDLIIMNYELYRIDYRNLMLVHKKSMFDILITDECHKIKSMTSQIGKMIHNIRTPQKIAMTATPVINQVKDLFNIFAYLDLQNMTANEYYKKYVEYEHMGEVKYRKLSDIKVLLQTNMLRRLKTDVLKDLPPVVHKTHYVDLTSEQRKLYRAVNSGDFEGIDFEELFFEDIPSELAKFARLCQISESAEIVGGKKGKEGSSKLIELENLLEEIVDRGEKAVVFSRSKRNTEALFEHFKQYNPAIMTGDIETKAKKGQSVSDRQENVDKFQNDENCKVIFCVITASAEGWTGTSASNVIFMSKHFSPAINGQCIGRVHRFGAEVHSSINVYSIIAMDTIDEKIEAMLEQKQHTITSMVESPMTTKQILELLGAK